MLYVKSKTKDIISSSQDLEKIVLETISKIAEVAGRTLGPGGRPVLIEREGLAPLVTKDGVTVVKALGLPSSSHNIILDTCKEISLNTARDAGDGTTTAIVLADALVKAGKQFMKENPKYNPQRFVNDLKDCYNKVVLPYLKEVAVPVKDEDLKKVAMISANGDEEIADAVVKAVLAAGDDGTVLIQEDQGGGMRVETIDGYIVTSGLRDIGAIGSSFINDRAGQRVRMDEGLVVLFDGTVNDLVLPAAIQTTIENDPSYFGRPIIVMAHGFADPVIEKFLVTSKGGVAVIPVIVPKSSLANSRTMFLFDMAAYTSASVMNPATAGSFEADNFGFFKSARINTYETFLQCDSDSDLLENRVSELKAIMNDAHSEHDKAHLRAAVGKLTGGISTVWVGGITDAEVRERRDRVQDAVEAVRSAVAEGIVAGGAGTHLGIVMRISSIDGPKTWKVMGEALTAPFKLLMTNCGEEDQIEKAVTRIENNMDNLHRPMVIFDASEHKYTNPYSSGIVEPAKVHRIAIGNAISVASLLTTLGGVVVSPRDHNLETQLEVSRAAFKDMLSETGE
jgi:chaperonin GroEL